MLRYYDEVNLLKPAYVDPMSGYRMYSVEQIPTLNKIVYLRDIGFHIGEIAAALKVADNAVLAKQLADKQKDILHTIKLEQDKLQRIEIAKRELSDNSPPLHHQINIKSIPGYDVLSLRRILPDYFAEKTLWAELYNYIRQEKIVVSNSTFALYHDTEYRDKDVDVEVCVLVNVLGQSKGNYIYRHVDGVSTMACMMVYGDFHNINGAYLSMAQWLTQNSQYHMQYPTRQIIHRGPWNEDDPEKYLIELQIPLDSHIV